MKNHFVCVSAITFISGIDSSYGSNWPIPSFREHSFKLKVERGHYFLLMIYVDRKKPFAFTLYKMIKELSIRIINRQEALFVFYPILFTIRWNPRLQHLIWNRSSLHLLYSSVPTNVWMVIVSLINPHLNNVTKSMCSSSTA